MSASHAAAVTAYKAVFRSEPTSRELAELDEPGLKRAYRRRALQCHPDRAGALGMSTDSLEREFSRVSGAYELLQTYIRAGHSTPAAASTTGSTDRRDFWAGSLPRRTLRLGEYLYYSGRIGRRNLDAAVAWQRRERPRFGTLARDWGMLTEPQIAAIMTRKTESEGIAQASVRLGFLSRTQAEAVLTMQTRRQKQLGVYLVALGAVKYDQLTPLLQEHVRHNAWALSYAA